MIGSNNSSNDFTTIQRLRLKIVKANGICRVHIDAQLFKCNTPGNMSTHWSDYIPAVKGLADGG